MTSEDSNTSEDNSVQPSGEVDDVLGPPPEQFDPAAIPTKILETVLLRFLARVIHADGEIHPKEMTMLMEVALKLELNGAEARQILDDEFSKNSDCEQLAAQIPDRERRREAYAMGCLMCCADGDADDRERDVLNAFAKGAEIPEEDAASIFDEVLKASKQAQAARA